MLEFKPKFFSIDVIWKACGNNCRFVFLVVKKNVRNTLFLAVSFNTQFLLDEPMCIITLCGIHFKCVVSTWILSDKRVSVIDIVKKRVSIPLFVLQSDSKILVDMIWDET